ncbi:hypothetical protein GWI33_004968 [Rhynchophorus ferrugineus]|uniref:Uncharacterized protein n=1 Tax=Rhynchophorus ferrugineus TaxID=354439 RepID=A0A834MK33_RHYFE|nr:hypothetical protein GWI33_004968 [Rhynchophorus ferrugineus]
MATSRFATDGATFQIIIAWYSGVVSMATDIDPRTPSMVPAPNRYSHVALKNAEGGDEMTVVDYTHKRRFVYIPPNEGITGRFNGPVIL